MILTEHNHLIFFLKSTLKNYTGSNICKYYFNDFPRQGISSLANLKLAGAKAESGEALNSFCAKTEQWLLRSWGPLNQGLLGSSGPWASCSHFTRAVRTRFSQPLLTCFAQADKDGNRRAVLHLKQGLD